MPANSEFGIIADDFTGAMDTGAQFAACGLAVRASLDGSFAAHDEVVVLSTDSREGSPAEAGQRAAAAARALAGRCLYKKIDSTLRGHTGVEALAVLDAAGFAKGVICPSVPAAGRVVRAGQLWVNGLPLHLSALGADPGWPANTSEVAARVGQGAVSIPVETVRGPRARLLRAVLESPARLAAPDTESEADLGCIAALLADAGEPAQPRLLPCGALALARAWLSALGHVAQPAAPAGLAAGPFVLACGSSNPAARELALAVARQVKAEVLAVIPAEAPALEAAVRAVAGGRPLVLLLEVPPGSSPQTLRSAPRWMGEAVRQVCAASDVAGLILMGGETARCALHAVEAGSVWVSGELAPGMAWGRVEKGVCHDRWLVTQSGGLSALRAGESLLAALR